jgi:hypothetical protein
MILFSVTTVLLFADQNLLAPNLTAIAEVGDSQYSIPSILALVLIR